ncbi:MAG: hypothetical protein KF715_08595 [Candidatus Didemnitutus sp.]|nr:hypothetical protein [Candidatus Didemnitutus sp.]
MTKPVLLTSAPVSLISNRDFKLPEDGWMQLFAYRDIPNSPIENPDGTEVPVTQVIDRQAADVVLSAFRAQAAKPNFGGVLVDVDHFSLDPSKESKAAAWIEELQPRDDGVWFKGRITNSGRPLLEGGDYRFISPVFEFPRRAYRTGERVRPIGLHSAGLTNDPRIKGGVPLSNRDGNPAGATEQNKTTMKEVNKLLGLAEDASEGSAVAAIQVILNRATQAEGSVTSLTKQRDTLLAAQVESDLEVYKEVITNRDDVKAQLLANREGTLKVLAALKKPATTTTTTITNRGNAKPPGGKEASAGDEVKRQAEEARAQRIANRATEIQREKSANGRAYPYSQAFADAERAEPAV